MTNATSSVSRRTALVSGLATLAVPSLAETMNPADAPVQKGLVPGMVIGFVKGEKTEFWMSGVSDRKSNIPFGQNSIIGIGSLTKLLTALLMAEMSDRGEISPTDSIQKYLPPRIAAPSYQGREITLLDLATYHPGLGGWPSNLKGLAVGKPFPEYPIEQLYEALAAEKPDHAAGTRYIYSNYGYGLLGVLLSNRLGSPFHQLVVERVCNPLGLNDTRMILTNGMTSRLATGYDSKLMPRLRWDLPDAIAGAGGFYSSSRDMTQFLKSALHPASSPLAKSFQRMLAKEYPGEKAGRTVALGWFIREAGSDRLIWKDGGVPGYTSVLAYSEKKRTGVFAAVNGEWGGLNDYAFNLIEPSTKAPNP